MTASHAHEHSHETPLGEICEVCILAGATDEGFEFGIKRDSDDADNQTLWWVQLERLALAEPISAPKTFREAKSIDPLTDPNRRLDTARAPPLYIF